MGGNDEEAKEWVGMMRKIYGEADDAPRGRWGKWESGEWVGGGGGGRTNGGGRLRGWRREGPLAPPKSVSSCILRGV